MEKGTGVKSSALKKKEAAKKEHGPNTKVSVGGNMYRGITTPKRSQPNKGIKRKMGGKVGKPKGVGCATRGYGKAMK